VYCALYSLSLYACMCVRVSSDLHGIIDGHYGARPQSKDDKSIDKQATSANLIRKSKSEARNWSDIRAAG